MPKLRRITTAKLIKLCEAHGYHRARQSGSHLALTRPGAPRPIIIPVSRRDALPYLIAQTIAHLGLSVDDYHRMLPKL